MAVQLARLTDLTVIATASRPESAQWARGLGAHHVLDHSRPLAEQVAGLGLGARGSARGSDLPLAVTGVTQPASP